ncbi:MAG: LacI family transcriptional regulator [Victivallaceae bacterium]|nr:LacI family transcriptional regulator [Victivallaceae bacterium]
MVVTQKFIAQQAGVSQKTVSLYFKGDSRLAAKTVSKLDDITEKYHYFPNNAAVSMKSNCFRRIACVIGQSYRGGGAPQIMSYVNSLSMVLSFNDYSLLLEPFILDVNNETVMNDLTFFSSLSVDGIVGIAASYIPPVVDEKIKRLNAPIVWLNRFNVPAGTPAVNFDEKKNALLIAEMLISKGYRDFVWFGPDFLEKSKHISSKIRCETTVDYIQSHGGRIKCFFNIVGEYLDRKAAEIAHLAPEVCICYNREYRDIVCHFARINNCSKLKIIHFASFGEINEERKNYFSFLELPEVEIAKKGGQYLLDKINKKESEYLLSPLVGTLHLADDFK